MEILRRRFPGLGNPTEHDTSANLMSPIGSTVKRGP